MEKGNCPHFPLRTIATLALLIASPGLAAPPANPPPASSDIVVTAERSRVIGSFVAAMTQSGPNDQIARWHRDICPLIAGVTPAQGEWIVQRIVEIGRIPKLRRASSLCQPSLIIIFAPDAAEVALEVERMLPVTLRTDGRARLTRFVKSVRPVRWISVTNSCGDGCAVPNSRLKRATTATLNAMLIIVDGKQIGGFSLGEIADYLALVSLTNPPLEGAAPDSSILSMFQTGRPAGRVYSLTDRDRFFLESLYRTRLDRGAREQQRAIETRMKRRKSHAPDR